MKKKSIAFLFVLIFLASYSFLSMHKSSTKKQKKMQEPLLTIVGYSLMADGLGRHSVELIEALKEDLDIGFKSSREHVVLDSVPISVRKILRKNRPMSKVILYCDSLGEGGLSFKKHITGLRNPGSIRIAYSMFESSEIPPEWVVAFNNYFDAVAVPDKFLIDVYRNSGVTIPIFEVPFGLNLDQFYNLPLKTAKNSPMVFANFSTATPRKNQLKLVQAFHAAFGNSKDVKLRLNSRYGDRPVSQAIKDEIRRLGATNIEFTQMALDSELYLKIFRDVDCYVSLSSGEGFSIQPREAMALGIPIIVTDNTGQSTICNSHFGRVVPSPNEIPAFYPIYSSLYGSFYDCTLESATEALRDVYQNYHFYLKQGSSAREWVKQYNYEQLKPLYLGLVRPKKVILGNTNRVTPDYLLTDSEELCQKFNQLLGTTFEDQRDSSFQKTFNLDAH